MRGWQAGKWGMLVRILESREESRKGGGFGTALRGNVKQRLALFRKSTEFGAPVPSGWFVGVYVRVSCPLEQ